MSTPQIRQTYRSIIRLIPGRFTTTKKPNPHPNTTLNPNTNEPYKPTALLTRLRDIYREPSASDEILNSRLQEAEQMAIAAAAQMKYSVLLERYNPGLSLDEKERIRLTARRVGFDLPVLHEENESGSGNKKEE